MSSGKHLLNTPESLVVDSLNGLCTVNPQLSLDEARRVVYTPRETSTHRKVSLISGGGSGHEPSHAGFVGNGLLDAAVAGNIFASPNVKQIRRAISLVNGEKGTLIVVMNYSGDALHFGLASEQHRASGASGGDVRVLLVGDDVSVGREQGGIVGRRGLAGTVLVYKLAAALSDRGASLDEVESIAQWACSRLGTFGIGLEHCHVPGTAREASHLATDEYELGMGIHNEPGVSKQKMTSVASIVDKLLSTITDTSDKDRGFVPFKGDGNDSVVLLVNNLGGVSELELGAVGNEAVKWLRAKGIVVKRFLSGTYMTSLEMPGFSITVLLLPRAGENGRSENDILELLDAPADAPGWRWYAKSEPPTEIQRATEEEEVEVEETVVLPPTSKDAFLGALERACQSLIDAEPEITRQDTIAGDGDAGLTLKAGAEGVLEAIESGKIKGSNVVADVNAIAEVCEDRMGGTSGSLYSIFISGLAKSLREQCDGGADEASEGVWASAAEAALTTLYRYTRARPPSRTLVDPLQAFVESLRANGLNAAAEDALKAANATKELVAKAGRGSYVNQDDLKKANIPDPGAWGIWRLVDGLRGTSL
jgi:dihydroxyacetone kinase